MQRPLQARVVCILWEKCLCILALSFTATKAGRHGRQITVDAFELRAVIWNLSTAVGSGENDERESEETKLVWTTLNMTE